MPPVDHPVNEWYDGSMTMNEVQEMIELAYGAKDRELTLAEQMMWLQEEVGELAQAIRKGTDEDVKLEVCDVFARMFAITLELDVDVELLMTNRYLKGCPKCDASVCVCDRSR